MLWAQPPQMRRFAPLLSLATMGRSYKGSPLGPGVALEARSEMLISVVEEPQAHDRRVAEKLRAIGTQRYLEVDATAEWCQEARRYRVVAAAGYRAFPFGDVEAQFFVTDFDGDAAGYPPVR